MAADSFVENSYLATDGNLESQPNNLQLHYYPLFTLVTRLVSQVW